MNDNRHPIETRHQTDTTEAKTRTNSLSKHNTKRDGKIDIEGTQERADKTTENCFVSPAVITINKTSLLKLL